MPNLPWSTAVVVVTALASITILAVFGIDTSDLVLIVLVLLGGAGAAQLSSIKTQVNGNLSKLMDELSETRKALAQSQPMMPPES